MIVCPKHHCELKRTATRYGGRLSCPVAGCTVVKWEAIEATPADQETRDARIAAHATFDSLWKGAHHEGNVRRRTYMWLGRKMGLVRSECHIGLFNCDQCAEVVRLAAKLKTEKQR